MHQPTSKLSRHALYFNGLNAGTLTSGEIQAIQAAAKKNIYITHLPIDWLSGQSFEDLLQETIAATEVELKKYGSVLLIGASAGGSLAINTFGHLKNKPVTVVTLCSRLHEPELPWWDPRTLERMAHTRTLSESRSFYDSVMYSHTTTLPNLTPQERQQIVIVKQWVDEVVPRACMNVAGLPSYIIPVIGHHAGIVSGIRHLEEIIRLHDTVRSI